MDNCFKNICLKKANLLGSPCIFYSEKNGSVSIILDKIMNKKVHFPMGYFKYVCVHRGNVYIMAAAFEIAKPERTINYVKHQLCKASLSSAK